MPTNLKNEKNFLEGVTHTYATSENHLGRELKQLAIKTFSPYMSLTGRGLEFGCSDGYMTSLIAARVRQLTVVDGASAFIEMTKARQLPNVDFECTLFEDFVSHDKFDYIFATYVLEHVNDAVALLAKARTLLSAEGLLFLVVPNARAMSRQLARHMGLLSGLFELTPNDINHGHRRVYDRALLNEHIGAAGLQQVAQGGLLLKPLADFQMNALIENEVLGRSQLDGLYKMGLEYPDFAGSIFSVCKAV